MSVFRSPRARISGARCSRCSPPRARTATRCSSSSPGDDPALLAREAQTLRALIAAGEEPRSPVNGGRRDVFRLNPTTPA